MLDTGTAQEALDLSARFQLDLIVADIMLGDTDGVAVVQQVLSRQDANVLFMTAVSDHEMRTRAEELKPLLFLQKPIDERALRRAIDESLSHRGEGQFADMNANFILDTLYDTAQIGMCITDENRRFVRVNRAYCANYGYPAQQLIGNEFTMVLPPEDREYAATVHDEFVAGTLVEMPGRWRVQGSDGEIKHIYVTAGRMVGRDGRTYKVTTVSDITSQLKHEHELEAALEEKQGVRSRSLSRKRTTRSSSRFRTTGLASRRDSP